MYVFLVDMGLSNFTERDLWENVVLWENVELKIYTSLGKILQLSVFHNFVFYCIWFNGDTFKIKRNSISDYLL